MRHLILSFVVLTSSFALAADPSTAGQVVNVPTLAPLIDSVKGAVVNLDVARRANQAKLLSLSLFHNLTNIAMTEVCAARSSS